MTDNDTDTEPTEADAEQREDTLPGGLVMDDDDYDAASVGEVKDAVERSLTHGAMDADSLDAFAAYESAHKDRVTLLDWLDGVDPADYDTSDETSDAAPHAEAERAVADDDQPRDAGGDADGDAGTDADAHAESETDAAVEEDEPASDADAQDRTETDTPRETTGAEDETKTRVADPNSPDYSEGDDGDIDPDDVDPEQAGTQQRTDVDGDPNATRQTADRQQTTRDTSPTAAGDDQTRIARENAATREDTTQVDDTQPHDPNSTAPRGRSGDDQAHAALQARRASGGGSGAHAESERNTTTQPQSDPNETTMVAVESDRTGYIGGIWFDDPETITVEWNQRVERAVREGRLHLRSARDESVIPDDLYVGRRQTSAERQTEQSRQRQSREGDSREQDLTGQPQTRAERNRERETRPSRADTESDDQYQQQPRDDVGYDETDDER